MSLLSNLPLRDVKDAVLVEGARRNEAWAQEILFWRYGRMVNGMVYRLCAGRVDLDEVVNDCFVEALRSLHQLEKPEAFGPWLTRIVINTCRRAGRAQRYRERFGLAPTRDDFDVSTLISPGAPPDVVAELSAIYKRLHELPDKHRIALVLRRVEERSLEEIAELMDASLASVKRWLSKAEAAVRLMAEGS